MRTRFWFLQALLGFVLFLTVPSRAIAADFGFAVVLRAGTSAAGNWEIGLGAAGATPTSLWTMNPYWGNNTAQGFTIGYQRSTNTAYLTLTGYTGTATYSPTGTVPTVPTQWTLPSSGFYVQAVNRPVATGITVSNLQLGSGLNILQGLSTTTLTAAQNNSPTATTTLAAPVVFNSAAGDWLITGSISFVGLSQYRANGASNSDLWFQLTAQAQNTPEPGTWAMLLGGLFLFAGLLSRRGRGQDAAGRRSTRADGNGLG